MLGEKKNVFVPFKDHPQFAILVDILSRKEVHHACLHVEFSAKWHAYFMKAFSQYLTNDAIPPPLRHIELIYLNAETLSKSEQTRLQEPTNRYRFLLFTQTHFLNRELEKYFHCVAIQAPTEQDKMAILKHEC